MTRYFREQVLKKRPYLTPSVIWLVIQEPDKREVQPDGRIRLWKRVPLLGDRVLRVVLLGDGRTVHNAFLDRGAVL